MKHLTTPQQCAESMEATPSIWSESISVTLGNASFVLTPMELSVKEIRIHGQLLVEAVYLAVRDEQWDTGAIDLRQTTIQTSENGEVLVRWQANVRLPGTSDELMDYKWDIDLVLGADGLRIDAHGLALRSFFRNRIGICVLLPDSFAGHVCRSQVGRDDESIGKEVILPIDIAPHQPVRGIGKVRINTPTADLALSFAGDVFEMEDQRNWTDASFKIYSTPLDLPWPVRVVEGDKVEQGLAVSWVVENRSHESVSLPTNAPSFDHVFQVRWQEITGTLVSIGLKLGSDIVPSDMVDLKPAFVQIEVSAEQWKSDRKSAIDGLKRKLREVNRAWDGRVGIVLAVRRPLLLASDDWSCLRSCVDSTLFPRALERVVALMRDVPQDSLIDVRSGWYLESSQALESCTLCVATTRYFAEINRAQHHLGKLKLQAVGYGINPQVHVFGDSELFDTLHVQTQTGLQAKRVGKTVHWWSVSLNPLNHTVEDKRLNTDLGAAWWLGSYIAALRAGVSSATWFSVGGDWSIQANSPLHSIMAEVSRIASRQTPPARVAIYAGPGVFGLRMDEAAWLVNCTEKSRLGWIQDDKTNNHRQVWLKPWQILSLWPAEGII